ncbi:MAG: hypothetical protein A2682_00275 [Candidatus Terrybacteria bacterium RIFCSPHIGHO2_01_FULL_58_15]|uniref:Response regulatory domain-containing protein n=1 Tax=Terrybacteria sp. (strain RIFCSPHIGHO2_01_FULL_58_15) TaxID=1802363 RepID=A0A1G2PP97_TERXR|nr:MAG: hypothetical protein A2682_00275 [Candidatus Terrybacteria bacterium RIFCSPHIGHO2_01_FULL_58_15]
MSITEPKEKKGQVRRIILVVEDDEALREAAREKLASRGLEVWTATSGEEALQLLEQRQPHLVWLDILMPGIDGLTTLQRIREKAELKHLPVVIVSVSGGQEKIRRALDLGALEYLTKSDYSIDDLATKMEALLHEYS